MHQVVRRQNPDTSPAAADWSSEHSLFRDAVSKKDERSARQGHQDEG